MFRVRAAHDEAFRQDALRRFVERVLAHLRQDLAKQTAGCADDALRARVGSCIERAKTYGLLTQREVVCFVDATYLLGEDFDTAAETEWAAEILRSDASAADRALSLVATSGRISEARRERE